LNLLFDLDGTLTDPQEGIVGSIQYALKKFSVDYKDDLTWCIGPPLQESFASILNTKNKETLDTAIVYYRERFATTGLFENKVYEGIPELLDTLQASGHRLFIATSKPKVFADKILKHFDLAHFFESIYGSELDGTRSNKAELIKYILETERLDAKVTLMIGDRKHDILGARANDLVSIGVAWGYGKNAELKDAGLSYTAYLPKDIWSIVTALC